MLSQLLVKFPRFTCNVTQYKCGVQRRVIKRLSIEIVWNGYINCRREFGVKVCWLSGKGSFVACWILKVLGSTPALVSFFCKEISPLFIFLIFLMLIKWPEANISLRHVGQWGTAQYCTVKEAAGTKEVGDPGIEKWQLWVKTSTKEGSQDKLYNMGTWRSKGKVEGRPVKCTRVLYWHHNGIRVSTHWAKGHSVLTLGKRKRGLTWGLYTKAGYKCWQPSVLSQLTSWWATVVGRQGTSRGS